MSTKSLRDKLEARIGATIEAIRGTPDHEHLPTAKLDPSAIATFFADEIQRYADALIPDATVRRNVLADDELAEQWPIHGFRDTASGAIDKYDSLAAVIERLGHFEVAAGRVFPMHPKVSADQIGTMLDRISHIDPLAMCVSEMFKDGRVIMNEDGRARIITHGAPPAWFGLPEDEHEQDELMDQAPAVPVLITSEDGVQRAAFARKHPTTDSEVSFEGPDVRSLQWVLLVNDAFFKAECRWTPPAVAVLAYVEAKVLRENEELQETRKRFVRTPSRICTTFIAGRARDFSIETKVRLDPTGRTFTAPNNPGFRAWEIDPPRGITPPLPGMSLPLDHDTARNNPFGAVREALGPNVLRFYLADWYLVGEQGNATGVHTVDDAHVLHDLLGYAPGKTTSKGKRYERPKSKYRGMLDNAYWCFEHTLLLKVGKTRFNPPHPLVQAVELTHDNGRTGIAYVPAPFAMQEFTNRFMQVPLAALRLGAHRTELVMGVASVIRANAEECFSTGRLSMTLRQWATRVGEPVTARLRHDGLAYWTAFRKELAEVIERGAFGTIHFGPGDGADVIATFEPGEDIGRVYEGLLDRRNERRALAERAALAVEVRKLEQQNPRPGRPRKPRAK